MTSRPYAAAKPVAPLRADQPTVDIESATAAIRLVSATLDRPLRPRLLRAAERRWQARLLHEPPGI